MMLYCFIAPLFRLLSLLPMRWLYAISDFLGFILYKIVKYRRSVVMHNLAIAFPQKTVAEREAIAKQFYRHLTDRIVEYIKTISISTDELANSVKLLTPISYFVEREKTGQKIVVMCSHIGAWEWCGHAPSLLLSQPFYGIYTAMSNKRFNDFFLNTRKKFKMQWIAAHEAKKFLQNPPDGSGVYIFISDQSPNNPAKGYWGKLFGVDTNFWKGGVKFAIQQNATLLYANLIEVERGKFTIETIELAANAAEYSEEKLINAFAEKLEKQLTENPSDWLWSHKRWKHKKM